MNYQVAEILTRYFQVQADELIVGGVPVTEIAANCGTPVYVYDKTTIQHKVRDARHALPVNFDLYFSIKANPNLAILRTMLEEGCGLEVASAGELDQALQAGCPSQGIVFAGPGKTRDELARALQASLAEIHVESLSEALCLEELAAAEGRVAPIALRVNPQSGAGGAMRMGGVPSPFGIDEEQLSFVLPEILRMTHLHVLGVHLFMGTQILDAETLLRQYQQAGRIARQVAQQLPYRLQTIDFGGGWGTPIFPRERSLDLAAVAAGLEQLNEEWRADPLLAGFRGVVEPGRYLVSEAGIYITRVTRVKESRGRRFAIVDGGMHHHLAASGNLGQTIKRNYPVAVLNRLGLSNGSQRQDLSKVNVVGPLCTPLDMLAREEDLPAIQPGDLVGVFQSGAYARTASPLGFLSHETPPEIMVSNGQFAIVRRRGTADDWRSDQPGCEKDEKRPANRYT